MQLELPLPPLRLCGDGENQVYIDDSRTLQGKGMVFLKLTSDKTLTLSNVLCVLTIRTNLTNVLTNVNFKNTLHLLEPLWF